MAQGFQRIAELALLDELEQEKLAAAAAEEEDENSRIEAIPFNIPASPAKTTPPEPAKVMSTVVVWDVDIDDE